MRIAILSRGPELYSTKRLLEAALKRGHEAEIIDTVKCYIDITSAKPMVYYKKRALDNFDAVIPRIGASITFYGTAVLRQFEMMGVYALNESIAISRARDKLRALQILSKKGIGLPKTSFAHATKMTNKLIDLVGGSPVVVKLLEGTQGKGVVLAETNKAAESVIEAFREMDANFLVQEYIKEAGGTDIRCLVVGEKVIASMKRSAKEGEFRSNLHRGGSAEVVKITPKEKKAAIDAAKAIGLAVSGVDLLRSNDGPKIMEVNSSPGLEGIETATQMDIADLIIEYIEQNVNTNKIKAKGKG